MSSNKGFRFLFWAKEPEPFFHTWTGAGPISLIKGERRNTYGNEGKRSCGDEDWTAYSETKLIAAPRQAPGPMAANHTTTETQIVTSRSELTINFIRDRTVRTRNRN